MLMQISVDEMNSRCSARPLEIFGCLLLLSVPSRWIKASKFPLKSLPVRAKRQMLSIRLTSL